MRTISGVDVETRRQSVMFYQRICTKVPFVITIREFVAIEHSSMFSVFLSIKRSRNEESEKTKKKKLLFNEQKVSYFSKMNTYDYIYAKPCTFLTEISTIDLAIGFFDGMFGHSWTFHDQNFFAIRDDRGC